MKNELRFGKKTFLGIALSIQVSALCQVSQLPADWQADPFFKNASIGFCVMDVSTGSVLAQHNPNLNLIPASTLKILTTGAALSVLGTDYRYKTIIATNGVFDKKTGVLNGDLIIVGSGDPSLQSAAFYSTSVSTTWAQQLKKSGLKEITGNIIGDGSLIKRHIPGTWLWEDVSNYYGAYPAGLNYLENKFQLTFSSGAEGTGTTLLSAAPLYLSSSYTIENKVIASGNEDNAYAYGDPFSFDKRVAGTIPPNQKKYEIEAALPDPALLCAEHLYLALVKAGITCDKKKISSRYEVPAKTETLTELISHQSEPLKKLVRYTNQHSSNLYCESMLFALGDFDYKKAMQRLRAFWQTQGIDSTAYSLEDGSGLSRGNTISARLLTQALFRIHQSETVYESFYESLPVAGKEGSMSSLGRKTFIENNLRAKTGYIRRARSYAGYVKTRSGKSLAFSIMVNHYDCSAKEARKRLEKFLVGLAEL